MAIRIGCGSWSDDAYAGLLYPPKGSTRRRLNEYAQWFDHVEVNSSYYSVPKRNVVENWIAQTPEGFTFDLKLHRNILSSVAKVEAASKTGAEPSRDLLAYTLENVGPLLAQKRLGTFFLLLPPHFRPEKNRLEELDILVKRIRPHRLAVELRHRDWVEGEQRESTLDYFREKKIVWVAVDMPRLDDPSLLPPVDEVTNPKLAYLRLHGRNPKYLEAQSAAERHEYLYNEKELKELVERIKHLAEKAENIHVVANNHARDFAPQTALALKRLLRQPIREVDWGRQ